MAADFEEGGDDNLYDAIQRLRPHWLYHLDVVFVDQTTEETIDWLRSTPTDGVQSIVGLSCEEATRLFVSTCMTQRYIHVIYRR